MADVFFLSFSVYVEYTVLHSSTQIRRIKQTFNIQLERETEILQIVECESEKGRQNECKNGKHEIRNAHFENLTF